MVNIKTYNKMYWLWSCLQGREFDIELGQTKPLDYITSMYAQGVPMYAQGVINTFTD